MLGKTNIPSALPAKVFAAGENSKSFWRTSSIWASISTLESERAICEKDSVNIKNQKFNHLLISRFLFYSILNYYTS